MTPCVEWVGRKNRGGYGRLSGTDELAHRKAWREKYGPIPTGLMVLHGCDNPGCVNLDHLFIGTQTDNMEDKVAKGRQRGPRRLTHCKRGHAFTPGNIYVYRGYRRCKQCNIERNREWRNK